MPHLLVAGTTGSGKSVGLNCILLSLLYRLTPPQCRLILVDPKVLELKSYDEIPHLLSPVVTEPAKAVRALKWAVEEMERRYRQMSVDQRPQPRRLQRESPRRRRQGQAARPPHPGRLRSRYAARNSTKSSSSITRCCRRSW